MKRHFIQNLFLFEEEKYRFIRGLRTNVSIDNNMPNRCCHRYRGWLQCAAEHHYIALSMFGNQ